MSFPNLKTYHKKPYAAIDPSRPELDQTGRTVVVTGGNSGIGFAIARSFITGGAARVIIIARRADKVKSAADELAAEAKSKGKITVVEGRVCDISKSDATEAFWAGLKADGIYVDVLVLNAAAFGVTKPILESSIENTWGDFSANVRSSLELTHRFYHQETQGTPKKKKFLVNISTCASYMWTTMAGDRPTYGLTKNATLTLLQQMAKDTKSSDMQIVSFHPGGVLTDAARNAGWDESMGITFDDENLGGQMAVWSASAEAEFLHGRFVWTNWDVEEIKNGEIGKQIAEDEHFLKAGIEGLTEKWGGMVL